jgi:hypothetical protein
LFATADSSYDYNSWYYTPVPTYYTPAPVVYTVRDRGLPDLCANSMMMP